MIKLRYTELDGTTGRGWRLRIVEQRILTIVNRYDHWGQTSPPRGWGVLIRNDYKITDLSTSHTSLRMRRALSIRHREVYLWLTTTIYGRCPVYLFCQLKEDIILSFDRLRLSTRANYSLIARRCDFSGLIYTLFDKIGAKSGCRLLWSRTLFTNPSVLSPLLGAWWFLTSVLRQVEYGKFHDDRNTYT